MLSEVKGSGPNTGFAADSTRRQPARSPPEDQAFTGASISAYRMSTKTIRALDRGLDVLRIIQESKAVSLNDLHLATRLPKATLLRILKTLIGSELIWQRIADGAYVPSYTFQSEQEYLTRKPILQKSRHRFWRTSASVFAGRQLC